MRGQKASVLAITVGFVLAFTMLGVQAVYLTGLNRELTQKQALLTKSFWLAEAGIARAFGFLNRDYWTGWSGSASTKSITPSLGVSGDYDVTVTGIGTTNVEITSTGYLPTRNEAFPVKKIIHVLAVRDALFKYAIFGDDSVSLKNNVLTDSFDSALGAYGPSNQGSNGDVGSNGTANGSVDIRNNVQVHGDVDTGPGGSQTVQTSNNAVITGDVSRNNHIYLPPVVIPASLTGLPPQQLQLSNNATTTIPAGDYQYSTINLANNVTVTITGEVNLYVTDSFSTGNNAQIIISPGAQLNLYAACAINLANNVLTNQNSTPEHLVIFSTYSGPGVGVTIRNNNSFSGAVYAPDADIDISNNGAVSGAVVGNTIDVANNAAIHYDENLGRIGFPFGGSFYTQHLWQELN